MIRTAGLVVILLLAQAPAPAPTRAQLLQQIIDAARQALALEPQPAPTATKVTNAAELVAAVNAGAPIVEVAAGSYGVNLVVTRPLVLRGPREAVLVPVDPLEPALRITGSDVSVFGLSVQSGAIDREALVLGDFTAPSVDDYPHRIRFEGVRVFALAGGHRGMALHGVDVTVTDSRVEGFYEKGRDSQAIWINGPGPYTITNNVLEASGENLLVGGADSGVDGVNPHDIVIRGNTFRKPLTYKTLGTVKNLFELKTGVGVTFEGNTLDGNWADGQDGTPIQITVRNQDGRCPWCLIDDVVIRGNVVKNAKQGFAVNVLGTDNEHPSGQLRTLTIDHNLFQDATAGFQVGAGVAKLLTITNNTLPAITKKVLSFYGDADPRVMTPLVFRDNVARTGTYGVTGNGLTGSGMPSLLAYATLTEWSGNILAGPTSVKWPNGQTVLSVTAFAALLDPVTFKLKEGTAGY